MSGGGKRDENPGIMMAGSLRERGENRAGSETCAFTGTVRNRNISKNTQNIAIRQITKTMENIWVRPPISPANARLTTYCGRFGSIASYNCSTLFDGMLTFPCKDTKVRQLT